MISNFHRLDRRRDFLLEDVRPPVGLRAEEVVVANGPGFRVPQSLRAVPIEQNNRGIGAAKRAKTRSRSCFTTRLVG